MDAKTDIALTLVRTLKAPASQVYAAWTDPKIAARWLAPGDMTAVATMTPKVGGRYRVEMRNPDGSTHVAVGEYKELVANKRIVKTWRWEESDNETRLAVDLREKSPGVTELTLTHSGFADVELRERHVTGWNGCLAKLEKLA